MAEALANEYVTTLNGAITNVATSLVVTTAPPAALSGGNFRMRLGPATDTGAREYILVGTVTGTTLSNITRGIEGSTAAAWANTDRIAHVLTVAGLADVTAPFVGASAPSNPTDGKLWWDTDDTGSAGAGSGTVFPASPTTNDLFFRTDLGAQCQYDGTRWCGPLLATRMTQVSAATADSNTDYNLMLARDIKIVRARLNMLVQTTNNASNYWTATLRDFDRDSVAGTAHGSASTAAVGSVWTSYEFTNSDVITAASRLGILYTFVKTGAPGAFHIYADFIYREIFT